MVKVLSGIKGAKKAAPKKPAPPAKKKTYKAEKEFIFINGTKASTALSKAVPAVKVRVSRGKSYDPNVIMRTNTDVVAAFRKFFTANKVEGQEQMAVMYLARGLQVIGIYMHTVGAMTAVMV